MVKYVRSLVIALFGMGILQAQWVTESYDLKAGWNAIWVSHDVTHDELDDLLDSHLTILQIWRWNPVSSQVIFQGSSTEFIDADAQWLKWDRNTPTVNTLNRLYGNSAYLVEVADGTANFTLSLKGKAISPAYSWSSDGTNLLGFATDEASSSHSKTFQTFFGLGGKASTDGSFYQYNGGAIGANPVQVFTTFIDPVERGKAYWVNGLDYSDFYGPIKIIATRQNLDYGTSGSIRSFRVENVTDSELTITLTPADSESAPTGQEAVAGSVPLSLRGALDLTTLQYDYTDFDTAHSVVLAAGEQQEFSFRVNRQEMTGEAGDLFQSLITVTDSLGVMRHHLPVTAEITSKAGLWVGVAVVNEVDQITAAPVPQDDGTATVEVTRAIDRSTSTGFEMRLILHRDADGNIRVLQKAHIGKNSEGEYVVTADESLLDADALESATRVSTAHFPFNAALTAAGADLGTTGTLSVSANLAHTDAHNPFLHTYHPDHDNKDAQFNLAALPAGQESFSVYRSIELEFTDDASTVGVNDGGWGSTVVGGVYRETISGLRAQDIDVQGGFVLYRVNEVSTFEAN